MAIVVYLLCTLTSALCAALLLREYKRNPTRLLFWSGLSFAGMAVTKVMPTPFWTIFAGSSTTAAQKLVALKSAVSLIWPVTVVLTPGARSAPSPHRYGSSVESRPAEPMATRHLPG